MPESDQPSPGSPLRGVLIGCGHVAQFHLTAWNQMPDATIVAVADRVPARASQRAEDFGIGRWYSDYREMLSREQPDFVDVATRPSTHLRMVSDAADAGANVLCQKPVAESLGDLQLMIETCAKRGVGFAVNENFRFQPWFRKARSVIERGILGKVHHVVVTTRARLTLPAPRFDEQPYFSTMPRLILYEFGVHMLDTLRYLFGEFDSVSATMSTQSEAIAGEDVATVLLSAQDGRTGLVDLSWASDFPASVRGAGWMQFLIEGAAGTLELGPDWRMRLEADEHTQTWQFQGDSQAGYTAMQRHYIECLQTGAEPETSGQQIDRTMELVFGAYDAAENHRTYRVTEDRARLMQSLCEPSTTHASEP